MFWVVTTSTVFCAISLADVLRCFATDQWNFWKSRKARALARFFSPEEQSRVVWKRLENIWPLLSSLRHIHFKKWRMIRDAWTRILDSIQTFLWPGSTHRVRDSNSESKTEHGNVTSGTQRRKVNGECCTNFLSSLLSREIRHYSVEKIYDIQFSPDGDWVVVCATINCHAIHVRFEVSLALNGGLNGITKRIYRLRVNVLPISYDK